MTLGCHQPYLFPYIGYFQLIANVDKFVLLDDVNAGNISWVRSNVILDGKFAVPVEKYSQNKLITELYFKLDGFGKLHKRLKYLYESAPHYTETMDILHCFTTHEMASGYVNVAEYNSRTIKNVCEYIGVYTQIVRSSQLHRKENSGQQRIIDICQKERADEYLNASGGVGIYDRNCFAMAGLGLSFLHCNSTHKLSILDLLMHKRPSDILDCLYECEIKKA